LFSEFSAERERISAGRSGFRKVLAASCGDAICD